jgi:hypothetical protein
MIKQMELAIHNLSCGLMDPEMDDDKILSTQGVVPYFVSAGTLLSVDVECFDSLLGDTFESPPGLADVYIETFPCYHTCETIAYGFRCDSFRALGLFVSHFQQNFDEAKT